MLNNEQLQELDMALDEMAQAKKELRKCKGTHQEPLAKRSLLRSLEKVNEVIERVTKEELINV